MSTSVADDGEIVQVPVPRKHLLEVMKFVLSLMDPEGSPAHDPARPWTIDELRELRQALTTRPTALALLDFTSSLDGEPLTFDELCRQAGETRTKARGELASLTTIVRKQFQHNQWPVVVQSEGKQLAYRMPAKIAALWSQVAEGR